MIVHLPCPFCSGKQPHDCSPDGIVGRKSALRRPSGTGSRSDLRDGGRLIDDADSRGWTRRVNTMSDEGDELIIATHDSLPRKAREPKTCSGTRRDDPPSAFACGVAEISTHKRNSKNTRRRAALNSRVPMSRRAMIERGRASISLTVASSPR